MGERARERSRAEVSFHLGLIGIVLPLVTTPVVWALAIHNLRHRRDDPAQRRWSRRLVALAVVDTLVAAAIVLASLTGMKEALEAPPEGPRIGVLLDAPDGRAGVRVREAFAGTPAEQAGILEGDRIVAAGGAPVATPSELMDALRTGGAVSLTLERDGQTLEVEVRPRDDVAVPARSRSAERCEMSEVPDRAPHPSELAPHGLVLGIVAVLWVLGRRRRVRQWTFWLPFAGVLVAASVAGSLGTWLGCVGLGGPGMRAGTAGLLAGEIVLVLLALVWFAIVRRRGLPGFEDERDPWPLARTYAVALGYALAYLPRVLLLSIPLLWAAQELGVLEVSPMLEQMLGGAGADLMSAVFVLLAAVLLAPIAEEVIFRGLLLPHLARSMAVWPALYVGAVVFGLLHVSHGVLLLGPLVLGAILGWARLRSRGLAVPILLHVSFNAAATLSSWLS